MNADGSLLEFLRGQPVITLFLALAAGYAGSWACIPCS
jgi:hypothetical protein